MTTTETYTRDEQDRAIDWAFQMGFGNALAQLDGDLQPPRHGRRRRCCTPCRVLDTAAAKLRDGSIPVLGAAHVEDAPDGRGTRGVRGHAPGARHLRHPSSRGPGRPKRPSPPSGAPLSGTWARPLAALGRDCGASVARLGVLSTTAWLRQPPGVTARKRALGKVRSEDPCVRCRYHRQDVGTRPAPTPSKPVNRRGC